MVARIFKITLFIGIHSNDIPWSSHAVLEDCIMLVRYGCTTLTPSLPRSTHPVFAPAHYRVLGESTFVWDPPGGQDAARWRRRRRREPQGRKMSFSLIITRRTLGGRHMHC